MSLWSLRYLWALDATMMGERRGTRDGASRDAGPQHLIFNQPTWEKIRGREGSAEFARVEQLCYLAGVEPDPLTLISSRYSRFKTAGGFEGAYGPRLRETLRHVCAELSLRPDSRRAVIPVFLRTDLTRAVNDEPQKADIPCTTTLVFWRSPAEALHVHATMRSTDIWFGLYYDVPAYHMLQRAVAWALGLEVGLTFFTTTSLHLYERHFVKATGVVDQVSERMQIEFPTLDVDGSIFGNTAVRRMQALQEWALSQLTFPQLA
jgi:hypothetical protein